MQFAPTIDERNGNFSTCGAACNRALTDPLTGQPFPGNQIPVSRFDPASVNVLKYIPQVGGDRRVQVPRLIGQHDNQVVAKVDQDATCRGDFLVFGESVSKPGHCLDLLARLAKLRAQPADVHIDSP